MANAQNVDGAIELLGLRKSFGQTEVLKGVDIRAGHGEFVSVVGPSGCGKTTMLNIIAGFEEPDAGEIRLGGQSMIGVPSHRRRLGMVFQNHALFPHMTIADNVGFGLAMRGSARTEVRRRASEALELVRLEGLGGRYPRELSGGQQQRVGIARALTVDPRVILMDEPLSSLDAKLRREMQIDLRRIQKTVGITAIYVTHDQEEALTLSDRIILMNRGQVEQDGTPEQLYSHPVSEFVAGFIGEANFFDAKVVVVQGSDATLEIAGMGTTGAKTDRALSPGQRVRLAVRPDRVRLHGIDGPGLAARVISRAFTGPGLRYVIETPAAGLLLAEASAAIAAAPAAGEEITWSVAPSDWIVLKPSAGAE